MSCTDFSIVYSDGECVESFHRHSSPLASGDLFTRIVEHSFAASCTVMIRREVLRQSDVFDPAFTVCEDWNLWLRIAHDHPVAIIPEVLCVVHAKRTQDANARPYELTRTAEIAALRNVLAAFPAMTPPRRHSVLRQIGRLKYEFGKYLLLQNQAQRSRENLRGAFRAYPLRASLLWLFSFASKNFFQGAVRLKRSVAAYR